MINYADIGSIISAAYSWATIIGISFTAASLAILLIQFIYQKS